MSSRREGHAFLIPVALGVVLTLVVGHARGDFVLGTPSVLDSPLNLGPPFKMFQGDWHPRISPDGLTLYLASGRPGGYGNQDLWMAERVTRDDPWGMPVNLGSVVNSSSSDYYPGISPDGLSLYFYSWRPGTLGVSDIWVTTRDSTESDWTPPRHLPAPVNSSREDRDPTVSADGLTLYFSSDRGGQWDIWKATRPSTDTLAWGNAAPVDAPISTNSWERYPHLSADGLTLCLTSDRPGGQGSADLYVAHRATPEDPWGEPENMGDMLNTPYYDYAHSITADGLELYLTMDGITFCAKRASTSEPWGQPVALSSHEVAGQFSADGLTLYFNTTRAGGWGYSDIWVTYRDALDAPWQEPVNLGPAVNSDDWEWAACVSVDGLELYFGSDHNSEPEGSNIWVSTRESVTEPWGQAVSLGSVVNSSVMDYHPAISVDKLTLVFASLRSGGVGQDNVDLWKTQRASVSEPWGDPVNLGVPINTEDHQYWPSFSLDGRWLFYTTAPPGGPYNEVMAIPCLPDGSWGPPQRVMWGVVQPQYALNPVLTPDGSALYFNSNVPEGVGGADIWQVDLVPLVDLNGDGTVNQTDEEVLQRHWGQDQRCCDIGPSAAGDGVVDDRDLAVLTDYMGTDVNDPTLISHWTLDETEGATAHDGPGPLSGSLRNGPAWRPEGGMLGGALEFDGINDYVRTVRGFDPAVGPFSVFAWVKGGAPGQVILSQADGADWLAADALDGRLCTRLGPAPARGGKTPTLTCETVITDGNWHRIGLVWDGFERVVCVDDCESVGDAQPAIQESDERLYFGCGCYTASGTYWSGLIDEIRLYNRAIKP